MKRTRILSIATALLAVSALPALAAGTVFSWKQTGHSLALVRGEQIVWQHNYHPAEGKPYFHPVTVAGSTTTARWMSFSGALPGGEPAAIIVLDHPSNLRHPSAWYLSPGMPFFSPAVLFSSPHTLPAGQSFTLKYRILFQPGAVDSAAVEEQWKQFAEGD